LSDKIIQASPIGFVSLDESSEVVSSNDVARQQFGIEKGYGIESYVHDDDRERLSVFLRSADSTIDCVVRFENKQKFARFIKGPDDSALWIQDLSHQKALERQLQTALTPTRKLTRDLRHITATALSYGELVQLILDDDTPLSVKAKDNLARYQGQLMKHLQAAVRLINQQDVSAKSERKHILIVDDETIVTEVLAELMRSKSYKVTSFTDSGSALKAFEINPSAYDLAIVDHHMPGLDGLTLARSMRLTDTSLPVVLCTNREEVTEQDSVQQVLKKPIDIDQLMTTVTELLE
tara:strand:- start:260 stop:1138 length:879 start_codon:yes stop_codon:yes gene_type:complete